MISFPRRDRFRRTLAAACASLATAGAAGCDSGRPAQSPPSREEGATPPTEIREPREPPVPAVEDVVLAGDGSDIYRLTADSVTQETDEGLIRLVNVVLMLHDSAGLEVAHLTSDRGDFDPVRDAMVVRGSVVLENAERTRRMETEELHYLPARDSVWSPVRSVYYRSGLEVRADSFVSDGQLRNVTAWGAVASFSTGVDP